MKSFSKNVPVIYHTSLLLLEMMLMLTSLASMHKIWLLICITGLTRAQNVKEFLRNCDVQWADIKHVSTRRLSLEMAIDRSLKKHEVIKSYFLSSSEKQARFCRLQNLYNNPLLEVHLHGTQFYFSSFYKLQQTHAKGGFVCIFFILAC